MKTKVLFSVLLAMCLSFTACDDDDDAPAKPVVEIHELGQGDTHGDDHTATIGSSLHMDAEIVAEGRIDYIQVRIHPEGEHHDEEHDDEWELEETFRGPGITGLKNLDFHRDLSIDESAEAGDYHFDIIVVDMDGNSGSDEADLELLEQSSNVTVTNLAINGNEHDVSKASGSFEISFDASVESGTLKNYSIEVHNHPESGNEADEFKIIDQSFTENFDGETSASVKQTITISNDAPTGEYHVEIIIEDSEGSKKVVSGHIDLEA